MKIKTINASCYLDGKQVEIRIKLRDDYSELATPSVVLMQNGVVSTAFSVEVLKVS